METTSLQSTTVPSGITRPDRIAKVAREFESIFTSMMIRAMRKTVGNNDLLPTGMGEKIYTGMLDDEYAKMLGDGSTLGLGSLIEKELRMLDNDAVKSPNATPTWMIDNRLTPRQTSKSYDSTHYENRAESATRWSGLINAASEKYDVDSSLIAAVIAQESGGNPAAISRAGAKGLMQLMDSTASHMGVSSPFNPAQNIEGGVRYLKLMLDKFDGNEQLALAAYNAGPGAVKKYNGIPPYRETQQYVRSVSVMKNILANSNELASVQE